MCVLVFLGFKYYKASERPNFSALDKGPRTLFGQQKTAQTALQTQNERLKRPQRSTGFFTLAHIKL